MYAPGTVFYCMTAYQRVMLNKADVLCTKKQHRVEGVSHAPASNGVSIHPSDNLDSIVPITDLINRLSIQYLCDNAAKWLVAEAARLL